MLSDFQLLSSMNQQRVSSGLMCEVNQCGTRTLASILWLSSFTRPVKAVN